MKIQEYNKTSAGIKDGETLPDYIKNLRLEKNFSLLKAERYSGLSVRYLKKIENASLVPCMRDLKLLSETYDVSLYKILKENNLLPD